MVAFENALPPDRAYYISAASAFAWVFWGNSEGVSGIRTRRGEGTGSRRAAGRPILRPRRPDMLVPRSQIEQTADGASTLILVFEAPSI
jgi:hypothetical protein